MCADGNPIGAKEALELGIVDRIVDGDLLQGAVAFLREKIAGGERPPKTRERNDKLGDEATNAAIFEAARDQAKKAARGMKAPMAASDGVRGHSNRPVEGGATPQ